MSISFSGLASGLDTSSWVESLVALREAKVESYEEEKTTVESLQETLSNIKSFFSSFRTMIEKVTDSSFGIPTMDIFAQKLASSSDASIVTALASTEAEEAEYDILVDNLATNTQAVSGYKFMTTITQTATATLNSRLTNLGVKAGDIGITVDSQEHIISITENDTLSSFITKLQGIGVESSYNENTGVFSINLNDGEIRDIDGTGIIDALNLVGQSGYESTFLETSTSETIVTTATGDTKLSELGEINAGNIVVNANDTSYTIAIDENTTLKDLVDSLRANGIDAELTSDGVLTIRDAEIEDIGATGIIDALGLESDMNSKTQIADNLQYETIVTTVTQATGDTKLNELTGWDSVGSNPELVIKDSSGKTSTVAVTGDMTLDDIIDSINNAGLTASLSRDGVLSISGGEVSGNVADVLGISAVSGVVGQITATGNILYSQQESYATGSNTLGELGINSSGGIDIYNSNNVSIGHITTDDDMTIDDIFAALQGYGINGSINNGKITLNSSNGNIIKGSVAEDLGIETEYEVTTLQTSSSEALKYTVTQNADGTTSLSALGLANKAFEIHKREGGDLVETYRPSSGTLNDLFAYLKNQYDMDVTINDGVISVSSDDYYLAGEAADILGIGVKGSVAQAPEIITGDKVLTVGGTAVADENTKISDIITLGTGQENVIIGHYITGTNDLITRYTVDESTTIGDLLNFFYNIGLFASPDDKKITDGVIELTANNDNYVADAAVNGVLSKLGMNATVVSTTTTGLTQTSSSPVYVTTDVSITESTVISDVVDLDSSNNILYVGFGGQNYFDLDPICTITITSTMTFGDLDDEISLKSDFQILGLAYNEDGTLAIVHRDADAYVYGSFADAIGWGKVSTSNYFLYGRVASSTKNIMGTSGIATLDITFGELGMTDSGEIILQKGKYASRSTITLNSTSTIGDLKEQLAAYSIDLSIDSSNGKIMISPTVTDGLYDWYIRDLTENIENAIHIPAMYLYTNGKLFCNSVSKPLGGSASGYITEDTKLVDLGFTTGEKDICHLRANDSAFGETTISFTIENSSTVGDLLNQLNNSVLSFAAQLSYGSLSIIPQNIGPTGYHVIEFDEEFANIFNLTAGEGYTYETTTIIDNTDSNRLTTGNAPVAATGSTTLGELGLVGLETFIKNKDNGAVYETMGVLATAGSTTLDELFRIIKDEYGIELSISNGVVTARNTGDYYMTGELAEALGVDVNVSHVINTPKTVTSSSSITYLTTVAATGSSKIGDFIQLSSSTPSYNAITLHAADGYQYRFSVTNSTTFDDLLNAFAGAGISATMSGGVISFNNSIFSGAYAEDAGAYGVLRKLGISTTAVSNVRETVAISQSSSSPVYVGSSEVITEDSLISDAISLSSSNNKLILNSQSIPYMTITITSTMTFGDLKDRLSGSINMTVNSDGSLSLSSYSNNYVSGSFADAVGWDVDRTVEYSGLEMKSSSALTYTVTVEKPADLNTKLGDIIDMGSGKTLTVWTPSAGTSNNIEFNSENTLNDLKQTLSGYGINMILSKSVYYSDISLSSSENAYVTGELADALGITATTREVSVGIAQTVDTSYLATATLDSRISDFIANWDSIDHEIRIMSAAGNVIKTVTISETDTFNQIFNDHNLGNVNFGSSGYSFSASMTNGVLTLTNTPMYYKDTSLSNAYLEGDIIDALGIGVQTTSKTALQTVGATATGEQLINTTNGSNADSSTKLIEFEATHTTLTMNRLAVGDKMTVSYYINENYNSMTYTVTSTSTIGDFLSRIETNSGVDASISNGRITFAGDDDHYVSLSLRVEAADGTEKERLHEYFGFDFFLDAYTTKTVTVKENTTSSKITGFQPITANLKMTDLGFDTSGDNTTTLFTYRENYGQGALVDRTVNITSTTTVQDIFDILVSTNAIKSWSLENGQLTITPYEDKVITSIYPGFSYCFNLEYGEGKSYDTRTFGTNSDSDKFIESHTETRTATSTTTLGELGLTSNGVIRGSAPAGSAGDFSLTFSPDDTIANLTGQLTDKGIFASFTNGKLIIRETTNAVITSMDSNLENILKMEAGQGNSYQYKTIWINTTSDALNASSSGYMTEDTLMSEIGFIKSNQSSVSTRIEAGAGSFIFNAYQDTTVGDLVDLLNANGLNAYVSNGKLNISSSGSNYLISLGTLEPCLNFNSGEGYTYETNTAIVWGNTASDRLEAVTSQNIDFASTFGELGMSGEGTIFVTKSDGSSDILKVQFGTTLTGLKSMLSPYNLDLSITDGKISISPNSSASSHGYITEISSNLLNALKLPGSGLNYTYTSTGSTNYENTDSDKLGSITTHTAAGTTTLNQLDGYSNGNGEILIKNGSNTIGTVTVSASDTIDSFLHKLADFDISGTLGSFLMGAYNKNYTVSNDLSSMEVATVTAGATRDTLLSDLGVTAGEYYIWNNGVKYTALISSDETLGSFLDTLASFGIQTGLITDGDSSKLVLIGQGNSYIAKSNSISNASNVVEKLFGNADPTVKYNYTGTQQISTTIVHKETATEDTLLSAFDTPWGNDFLKAEGSLALTVNGENKIINITSDETFGSLVDKLNAAGVNASFFNGKLYINDSNVTVNTAGTTSSIINPNSNIYLTFKDNLDGYLASDSAVIETTTIIEEKSGSAASWATLDTKMGDLNISEGTLSLYRDGEKAVFNIDPEKTFRDLKAEVAAKFADVDLDIENGVLVFKSKTDGVEIEVGATTDTSNFSAVTGLSKNEETGKVESARELYNVNVDSIVTNAGLFRRGQVTEGTFTVGNQEITIGATTTLADIISQINNSDEANATAYWDSIDGKLVIKSRTTGAALINIEAGTSNFTDIMGYTSTERNADGSVDVTRMNVETQKIGENARFSINGTTYTSSSNTVTSDISRIKGLTLELKDLTEGAPVTITVERDKETVANALSDVVDSYNELMKNLDESLAVDGSLHRETTLKLIRNQLRNLMTSSDMGATVFRNLDAIGISVDAASANNISTSNESIINLTFDKDKFLDAYEADADAVKALLVGGDTNKGVFTQVETLLENSLEAVSGYFAITEEGYQRQINRINEKIEKETLSIEKYRARLEKKFSAMDLLIAQMQQQYSSFLTT